ncbi:hypothetical protein [Paenibacillus sp. CAA11]|uniref:hypothetical protein n=1 Tax=Paenibacillus sp. CAA11 TaxID=1532905 RepID=UPI001901B6A6|nr:hypothetical protein [Paenibacillus sp. CAA11]
MTKAPSGVDKNLLNEVEALETDPVNSHQAQQLHQDRNDRRHQDAKHHYKKKDMDPTH